MSTYSLWRNVSRGNCAKLVVSKRVNNGISKIKFTDIYKRKKLLEKILIYVEPKIYFDLYIEKVEHD